VVVFGSEATQDASVIRAPTIRAPHPLAMTTLLDFLENARFPNPPVTGGSANTTDVSLRDMGLVDDNWKARRVIRDDALVDNLCDTLRRIIGQTPIPQDNDLDLLKRSFSPELDRDDIWRRPNNSEAQVRHYLLLYSTG
jgi:hypothetical protein